MATWSPGLGQQSAIPLHKHIPTDLHALLMIVSKEFSRKPPNHFDRTVSPETDVEPHNSPGHETTHELILKLPANMYVHVYTQRF